MELFLLPIWRTRLLNSVMEYILGGVGRKGLQKTLLCFATWTQTMSEIFLLILNNGTVYLNISACVWCICSPASCTQKEYRNEQLVWCWCRFYILVYTVWVCVGKIETVCLISVNGCWVTTWAMSSKTGLKMFFVVILKEGLPGTKTAMPSFGMTLTMICDLWRQLNFIVGVIPKRSQPRLLFVWQLSSGLFLHDVA